MKTKIKKCEITQMSKNEIKNYNEQIKPIVECLRGPTCHRASGSPQTLISDKSPNMNEVNLL